MSADVQDAQLPGKAKRRLPWFAVACAAAVAFVGMQLAYELWMRASIAKITTIRVQRISVIKLQCSPEHFWGQSVVYKRLTDDYERYGVFCRDWKAGAWILQDNRP
jgi:TRAP-type C4-dicarboxylate transport system permease small subunit